MRHISNLSICMTFLGGYVTIPLAQENHPYDLWLYDTWSVEWDWSAYSVLWKFAHLDRFAKSRNSYLSLYFSLSPYVCVCVLCIFICTVYMYIFKVCTVELFPIKPKNGLAKRPRKSQALWTWETLRRPRGGLDAVWRRPDGAKAAAGVHMRES